MTDIDLVTPDPTPTPTPARSTQRSPTLVSRETAARARMRANRLRREPMRVEDMEIVEDFRKVAQAGTPGGSTDFGLAVGGLVGHTPDAKIPMWKPYHHLPGWRRMLVPEGNLDINLTAGFRLECPDCGDDCGANGNSDPRSGSIIDLNLCPGRAAIPYRQCRVCGHKIHDMGVSPELSTPDPNRIDDENLEMSTPQSRTQVEMDRHYAVKHPREWEAMVIARQKSGVPLARLPNFPELAAVR